MIRAVLFDYGMVFSMPAQAGPHEDLLKISGISSEHFDAIYWKYRLDYDGGTLNKTTYWETVALEAGTTFTAEQIVALNDADIRMWTQVEPRMVAWAQQLQQSGWVTGILSNIGDGLAEWMVPNFAWLKGFKHCTWSYQLKLVKPDVAIYEKTVAALGVKPEEVLFLDDLEKNIIGAKAAGLNALRFTTLDALVPQLAEFGVPEPTQ
jgi:putative hydrolase of the HAD superfamily